MMLWVNGAAEHWAQASGYYAAATRTDDRLYGTRDLATQLF